MWYTPKGAYSRRDLTISEKSTKGPFPLADITIKSTDKFQFLKIYAKGAMGYPEAMLKFVDCPELSYVARKKALNLD
jgi:hypothetical protein